MAEEATEEATYCCEWFLLASRLLIMHGLASKVRMAVATTVITVVVMATMTMVSTCTHNDSFFLEWSSYFILITQTKVFFAQPPLIAFNSRKPAIPDPPYCNT